MSTDRHDRAVAKIAKLSSRPVDLVTLWRESSEVLMSVVPYFWTPCFYTLDPASMLVTSHYHDGLAEFPPEWLAAEYYHDDVHRLADVAVSPSGISTLAEATDGNPQNSPRWHRNISMGGDQELIARLRTSRGEVWGMLGLYREPGRPLFDQAEKDFLLTVGPYLADGARRALLYGEAMAPEHVDSPALLVLDERWHLRSSTPGARRRLDDFPDGDGDAGRLPSAVLAVAGRAMTDRIATSRVRSRSGQWLVLHGSRLVEDGADRVAVIIEAAYPARIYPLLVAAYGLTDRERDVTGHVLQGASTADIAAALSVSSQTVQQHLKSIFDKTGVRSRRDLVAKMFFTHYEPRFRDNERRTAAGQPARGGPALPPPGTGSAGTS